MGLKGKEAKAPWVGGRRGPFPIPDPSLPTSVVRDQGLGRVGQVVKLKKQSEQRMGILMEELMEQKVQRRKGKGRNEKERGGEGGEEDEEQVEEMGIEAAQGREIE